MPTALSDPVSRRPIRPLPPDVIDRIAAGEVVQRPANVVKELVENALDGGATDVLVAIEDGGRTLIRVVDDGCGIPADELPLAFRQHATSKVTSDADLEAVATLGFRGEALASIGSVSRARITSRVAGADAYALTCDGGRLDGPTPAAGNVGTTVDVRDVFFNTPARRKFLKAAAAESGAITDTLQRLVLPHPGVRFRYERDGRPAGDWPPTGDPWQRLAAAWPGTVADGALRIDVRDGGWRLWGLVARPEHAATTTRLHHLFVNGRPITDRSVQHAAREAFRGLTEPGRHPAVVLLLDVPAGGVDVNVHPTKAEVRFREPSRVWSLVNATIREALLSGDLTPAARPVPADPPTPLPPRDDVRQTLADFFKDALRHEQRSLLEGASPSEPPPGSPETAAPGPPPATPTRVMQLHNSYLVVEGDDGMEIIDQHALHERVLYEELLSRVRAGPLESQRLLLPAVAECGEAAVARLGDFENLLRRLGIEAEPFGVDAVAVHAFPTLLLDRDRTLDPAAFVADLLSTDDIGPGVGDEAALHVVLDMMACKAAVKAGDPLTDAEIRHLVARRHLAPRASNCPHGRPTTLRLTLGDLEKQFKRRGF